MQCVLVALRIARDHGIVPTYTDTLQVHHVPTTFCQSWLTERNLKIIIAAGVLGLPSYEWYCILLLTSCTAADTAISSWVSETSRLTPWLAQNLLTVLAEQPRPTPIWDRCSATSLCVWCFKIMSKITSLYGSRDMVLHIQWCGKKYFRVTNLASEN